MNSLTDSNGSARGAPYPELMNTQTARYIVRANLPLTHPRHPAFREMVAGIQPRAPLPSVGLIRQNILDLAEAFRQDVTDAMKDPTLSI
jgi:hypothetical protein